MLKTSSLQFTINKLLICVESMSIAMILPSCLSKAMQIFIFSYQCIMFLFWRIVFVFLIFIWLTTGVTLYHLLSMSFILSFYKTDDVTFSKTSFFLCDEREFFRLGNVPLRVISGHPLLKSNSTSSLAPAVLAYDTADLPSWSIALTFALD